MTTERPTRDRQRGNSLLLALIVLSALATLGSLTVVSVQSSLKTSSNERSQTVAMYAAESGAALAIEFLRANRTADWTPYLTGSSVPVAPNPAFPSNRALPGTAGNPFTDDQNAWFEIQFLNNRNERGGDPAVDVDKQVIIRSTGHGPQGSVAIIEWEVQSASTAPPFPMTLIGWRIVL